MKQTSRQAALVLSGGGAYGAFAVGVMKVLFAGRSPATSYQPLDADVFCGTSVGAFNAACMVSRPEISGLEAATSLQAIWLQRIANGPGRCRNGIFRLRGNPEGYLGPGCYRSPRELLGQFADDSLVVGRTLIATAANFLASSTALADRTASAINVSAFIDPEPFYQLLRETIKEEAIRLSPRRLNFVATNWSTGRKKIFQNADFAQNRGVLGLMASTAIPGVFPPVEIENVLYADGGVVENTPLSPALKDGAANLHVIYLNPEPRYIPLKAAVSSMDSLLRVYYLMQAVKIHEDIETARWINDGLRGLAKLERTPDPRAALDFAKVSAQVLEESYRLVTVHKYSPQSSLGDDFGMLDFQQETIVKIIEEGEKVALSHDCEASECLV